MKTLRRKVDGIKLSDIICYVDNTITILSHLLEIEHLKRFPIYI